MSYELRPGQLVVLCRPYELVTAATRITSFGLWKSEEHEIWCWRRFPFGTVALFLNCTLEPSEIVRDLPWGLFLIDETVVAFDIANVVPLEKYLTRHYQE